MDSGVSLLNLLRQRADVVESLRTHAEFRKAKVFLNAVLDNLRVASVSTLPEPPSNVVPTSSNISLDDNETKRHGVTSDSSERFTEFFRQQEDDSDTVYRVPRVNWSTPRLSRISFRRYGLLATFRHIEPPPLAYSSSEFAATDQRPATVALDLAPPMTAALKNGTLMRDILRRRQPLKVAVEMSGHMRTFRQCRETTVQRLLQPNHALLFVATYPDMGDKRYGVREQLQDEPAPLEEIADAYGPHLAAVYLLDLPSVTVPLRRQFPTLFGLRQWSWLIYQLFTMELTHNVTLQHVLGSRDDDNAGAAVGSGVVDARRRRRRQRDIVIGREEEGTSADDHVEATTTAWRRWRGRGGFDVVIRIRPDLYVVAAVRVYQLTAALFGAAMSCGTTRYWDNFTVTQVLRAPHHPTIQWYLDKLSDHSAIGTLSSMTKLLTLYSAASRLLPSQQQRSVFFQGQTAERLWNDHAKRRDITFVGTFGWHVMLRDPQKYRNTTEGKGKSVRRAVLNDMVFGQTNGRRVSCPDPAKKMRVMGPPPKRRRGGDENRRGDHHAPPPQDEEREKGTHPSSFFSRLLPLPEGGRTDVASSVFVDDTIVPDEPATPQLASQPFNPPRHESNDDFISIEG